MSKFSGLAAAGGLLVTALLVASCSSVSLGTGVPAVQVEQRGPAGVVPPTMKSYYSQPLSWGECASYATNSQDRGTFGAPGLQCARMNVPLVPNQPSSPTISIALMRIRASDRRDRIGSMLTNPGGPGGSGLELVANIQKMWEQSPLSARFDLIGFDPRGVGASEPAIRCLTGRQQDRVRASDLDDATSASGVAAFEQQQRDYAAACASNTRLGKAMLANVTTKDVAADMDIMRSVLGDAKLTYLGYSYGTYLGTLYAEMFPSNVRAMILDGAVDPTESVVDETVGQGAGFQNAFNQFAKWCAQQGECALGDDPANATKAFQALVDPLLNHPIPVGDGRRLGYDDATTAAIQALYSQQYWTYLNQGLDELKDGTGATLMSLADAYDGRNPDGTYSNEQDAFTAIRCVDTPPVTDPKIELETEQRFKQVAPFLDDGMPSVAENDACAYWPVPSQPSPSTPHVPGLAKVLVISTTNDPATPYQAGVNLAKELGGGLLTFVGTQHTAFLQGISCVDQYGAAYLTNLTLPPSGARCTR